MAKRGLFLTKISIIFRRSRFCSKKFITIGLVITLIIYTILYYELYSENENVKGSHHKYISKKIILAIIITKVLNEL